MQLKSCARATGATILLTTHPRGMGAKAPGLASMAGGSAWPRFVHAALWLERHEPAELRLTSGAIGTCNRTMHITKSRFGRGGGLSVGLVFDSESVRFREVGTLAPSTDRRTGRAPTVPSFPSRDREAP
jgi:hypothetical protein